MGKSAPSRGSYDVDEDFKKYVAAIYWVQGPSTPWVNKVMLYDQPPSEFVNILLGIYRIYNQPFVGNTS